MRLHRGDYDDVVETRRRPGRARQAVRGSGRRARSISSTSTARGAAGRAPSSSAASPRRSLRRASRPRAASARSRTPRPCSTPAPTASSSARPRSRIRRPWARGARRAARRRARRQRRDGAHRRLDGGVGADAGARGRALPRGRRRARALHRDRPRRDARGARPRRSSPPSRPRGSPCSPPAASARPPTSRRSPDAGAEAAVVGRAILAPGKRTFGVRKPRTIYVDPFAASWTIVFPRAANCRPWRRHEVNMRKLAITLAVLTTLALAAVAGAALPQKGAVRRQDVAPPDQRVRRPRHVHAPRRQLAEEVHRSARSAASATAPSRSAPTRTPTRPTRR